MTEKKIQSNDLLNLCCEQIISISREYFLHPDHLKKLIATTLKDREVLNKLEQQKELSKYDQLHLDEYLLRTFRDILFPKLLSEAHTKALSAKQEEERLEQERIRLEIIAKREKERLAEIERQKALEADPIYQAQQRVKVLLRKYDINRYSNSLSPQKIIDILSQLEVKTRLSKEDALWLHTEGKEFFNRTVRHAFHRLEADFYLGQYQQNKNELWHAINASSQLRKCKASQEAEKLLSAIQVKAKKDKKLVSAYFTTLGGVRRDLHKMDMAIENAEEAHHLTPQNYRPCTLLGAIYMETRHYSLGHEWYEKAKDRGAPDQSIQTDLKSIIMKLDKDKRNDMIEQLLKLDAHTYQWLNNLKFSEKSNYKKQNTFAESNKPKVKQNVNSAQTQKKQKKGQPKP